MTELLSIKDTAERLGCDASTVRGWIRKRGFPVHAISSRSRWCDWDEVVTWIKQQDAPPPPSRVAPIPIGRGQVIDLRRQ